MRLHFKMVSTLDCSASSHLRLVIVISISTIFLLFFMHNIRRQTCWRTIFGYSLEASPLVRDAAICVSGQVRTLDSTIHNISKNLLDTIDTYDVFMFVQTRESVVEPKAGDLSVCKLFKINKKSSTLCSVTKEMALNTSQFLSLHAKENYVYSSDERRIQGLLQQLLGLKTSFEMMESYSELTGVMYKWVIRLRPDNWIPHPVPSLSSFGTNDMLIFSSQKFRCCGNEDIFAIGTLAPMRIFMKRIDFMALDFVQDFFNHTMRWTSESYVIALCSIFNISYTFHDDLHIHVERWPDSRRNSDSQP